MKTHFYWRFECGGLWSVQTQLVCNFRQKQRRAVSTHMHTCQKLHSELVRFLWLIGKSQTSYYRAPSRTI